jgi:hypothetical protein
MKDPKIVPANEHAVWGVYDFQRTMLLNVKYYGQKLHSVERQSLWMEVLLAITAPGSAVAAIWLKEVPYGEVLWKLLTALAAFTAIIKPFLRHAQRIKQLERVLVESRQVLSDVEELVYQIRTDRNYSKVSAKYFEKIIKKKRALVRITPESVRDKKLVETCMLEVNEELPTTNFYIPEE